MEIKEEYSVITNEVDDISSITQFEEGDSQISLESEGTGVLTVLLEKDSVIT